MKKIIATAFAAALLGASAQAGTLTFDGEWNYGDLNSYTEQGFEFDAPNRAWLDSRDTNGSVYLADQGKFTMSRTDGAAFDFKSIDIAQEYNVNLFKISWTNEDGSEGSMFDGGNAFFGTAFQTLALNLSGITQITFESLTGYGPRARFDNFDMSEVSPVPLPGAAALFLGGMGAIGAARRKASAKA